MNYALPLSHLDPTIAVQAQVAVKRWGVNYVSTAFAHTIERYGVAGEVEELLERAELVRGGDGFVCRVDGEDRLLEAHDVAAAIALVLIVTLDVPFRGSIKVNMEPLAEVSSSRAGKPYDK
jgi:hypothetical protein